MAMTPGSNDSAITLTLTIDELELLCDGLHALEYWDYATELDLPRRNGQVSLPEDDPSVWVHTRIGADEENAIDQIRRARQLRLRLTREQAEVGLG